MTAPIFKMAKLRGFAKVRAALKHNKRAIQAETGPDSKFSVERSALNRCLVNSGTADEAISNFASEYKQATGKPPSQGRKNEVSAVEIVVSVSTDNPEAIFYQVLKWTRERFDCPIISADIHLDESYPHLHIIMLPLIEGKMRGSDLVGSPGKLRAHRKSFYENLGVQQPKASQRSNEALSKAVIRHMLDTKDPATLSPAWELVRAQIEADPVQFGLVYGVTATPEKQTEAPTQKAAKKRFLDIMTAPQKLEREKPNNSLSCV